MVIASASAQFTTDIAGKHVEHHAVIVIKAPKLSQVQKQMILDARGLEQAVHRGQAIQRRQETRIPSGNGSPPLQHFFTSVSSRRFQNRPGPFGRHALSFQDALKLRKVFMRGRQFGLLASLVRQARLREQGLVKPDVAERNLEIRQTDGFQRLNEQRQNFGVH